jgi:hypothetical protein
MFKLVGKEHFKVGKENCTISIDACSGFAYEYTLSVNGKSLEKFKDNKSKTMKCWYFTTGSASSTPYRVVLGEFFIISKVNSHPCYVLHGFPLLGKFSLFLSDLLGEI